MAYLSYKTMYVSVLLGNQFSWEEFRLEVLWYNVSSGVQTDTRSILFPADPWALCTDGSWEVLLGLGIGRKIVVLPVLKGV